MRHWRSDGRAVLLLGLALALVAPAAAAADPHYRATASAQGQSFDHHEGEDPVRADAEFADAVVGKERSGTASASALPGSLTARSDALVLIPNFGSCFGGNNAIALCSVSTRAMADLKIDDVEISGPTSEVLASLNIALSGNLSTDIDDLPSPEVTALVTRADAYTSAILGNATGFVRSATVVSQRIGTNPITSCVTKSDGVDTDQVCNTTGASFSGVITTEPALLPVGEELDLLITLSTEAFAVAEGRLTGISVTLQSVSNFGSTVSLPTSGPVLNLPEGYSVTSEEANIVGNRWVGDGETPPADATPPVLSVPGDVAVDATMPDGAVVSYSATATDETDPAPAVSCAPASGATFAIGTTAVTCTATDAAGNDSSGSFFVHVRSATEQIETLQAEVWAEPGMTKRTLARLVGALDRALERPLKTCHNLGEFVLHVQAAEELSPERAAGWIADATRIRTVLAC